MKVGSISYPKYESPDARDATRHYTARPKSQPLQLRVHVVTYSADQRRFSASSSEIKCSLYH